MAKKASSHSIIQLLDRLIRLDTDTRKAYLQAVALVHDDRKVADPLRGFAADHQRHVADLKAMLRKLGGTPTEGKPDAEGFLGTGITAIRTDVGARGALDAMRSNLALLLRTYQQALDTEGLPREVRDLLKGNHEDAKRHLAWIEAQVGEPVAG